MQGFNRNELRKEETLWPRIGRSLVSEHDGNRIGTGVGIRFDVGLGGHVSRDVRVQLGTARTIHVIFRPTLIFPGWSVALTFPRLVLGTRRGGFSGMELMAERGGTTVLRQEIADAISLGSGAAPRLLGAAWEQLCLHVAYVRFRPDRCGNAGIDDRTEPRLVRRCAWTEFTTSGLWLRTWETPLHPYDAGTTVA